jgi:hypothetical protein
MIAYQEYNTKSPLNGLAAKWAAEHASLLPVDARPLAPSQQLPASGDASADLQTEPSLVSAWDGKINIL